METRTLGRSDLKTIPFVLGGNVFGWTIDPPRSFEILDAFVDQGGSLIDTADIYSNWKEGNQGGESETIIGNWLKRRGSREGVLIATKCGGDMGEGRNLRKDYILRAAEASLRRLQTDHIDLYQAHYDDPATPLEETLAAYEQLVKEGKVRFIGASNYPPARLEEALQWSEKGLPRYESLQPRYNLYDREEFETKYQQLCLGQEVGVIPYYGLASGFLSGKYRSEEDLGKSARGSGVTRYFTERGFRILDALDQLAVRLGRKPATIAMAWLMQQPSITGAIASATSTDQLTELFAATRIHLDEESIDLLQAASRY
jgi:aryl-alcohol dehydrogenase-like predicted oxidoreductase